VQPETIQPVASPEPTPEENLEQVLSNPDSSVEERVEAIIATIVVGEAIDLGVLEDAGISYADLPPETPVAVREDSKGNSVVIDAKTAEALKTFSSTEAFLEVVISDPAAVVAALASVGADMSQEERRESEQVVVASVIVSNVASVAANAAAGGGAIAYRRKP
jgi:Trk K+ transport system NAD-binding subunit